MITSVLFAFIFREQQNEIRKSYAARRIVKDNESPWDSLAHARWYGSRRWTTEQPPPKQQRQAPPRATLVRENTSTHGRSDLMLITLVPFVVPPKKKSEKRRGDITTNKRRTALTLTIRPVSLHKQDKEERESRPKERESDPFLLFFLFKKKERGRRHHHHQGREGRPLQGRGGPMLITILPLFAQKKKREEKSARDNHHHMNGRSNADIRPAQRKKSTTQREEV